MNIYILNSGGFYAIGTAVIAAPNVDAAADLANAASDKKWNLKYYPFGGNSTDPVGETTGRARVINIHEWGMPHLPSKGTGIKVTF